MNEDQEFEMMESFNIDNGELDSLSNVECFVLGVEWQTVYEKLLNNLEINQPINAFNELRLIRMLKRNGRTVTTESVGNGWVNIYSPITI